MSPQSLLPGSMPPLGVIKTDLYAFIVMFSSLFLTCSLHLPALFLSSLFKCDTFLQASYCPALYLFNTQLNLILFLNQMLEDSRS